MKYLRNKKVIYILFLGVICLLPFVLSPTYAKFISGYVTEDDVVEMNLNFDISITGMDEYHELKVAAGEVLRFNVALENGSSNKLYYGVWYKMVSPSGLPNDGSIKIGKLVGTSGSSSGELEKDAETVSSFGIVNSTNNELIIYIGIISSSSTSVSDLEYLNGKKLISGEVDLPRDIEINNITIDGASSNSLPTSGMYEMSYTCSKGSTLSWDTLSKSITFEKGSKSGDTCSLVFTSSNDYPLLSEMPIGSYVAYEGVGGTVGSTSVNCQLNGPASSSTPDEETEAPNSCLGQNAREDLDDSGYTYGYCYQEERKNYTTGWRLAYLNGTKPVIVSAGAPECRFKAPTGDAGTANFIRRMNTWALKYCNPLFADGGCSCLDADSDGYCDSPSTDAWSLNDNDFYNITKSVNGVGKRLAEESSNLGDVGGELGEQLFCMAVVGSKDCGYNIDLIDNGVAYWFASQYTSSSINSMYWRNGYRRVGYSSYTNMAFGIRPVINLSNSVYVVGGAGTMDDPYQIESSLSQQMVQTSVLPLVKVTLNGNGASNFETTSVTLRIGTTYGKLPILEREGYEFLGWYDADVEGNQVLGNTVVESLEDHTLFARWSPKTYTVTFSVDSEMTTVTPDVATVTYGEKYGVLPIPVLTGDNSVIFDGWYTEEIDGEKITDESIVTMNKDHVLYARWIENSSD